MDGACRSKVLQSFFCARQLWGKPMFAFLRKRVLKEHTRLVTQNHRALAYLGVFLPAAANQQYSAFLEDVNSAWQPGEKLSDETLEILLTMNMSLRRAYDVSPARSVGMKSFDDEFKPFAGWEDYYSQHL
jgi:hypothetical protein